MNPEDLASLLSEFSKSEIGKWYINELERRERAHISNGQSSELQDVQVASLMKSAGVNEALRIIKEGVAFAEHYKK